MSPVRLLLNRPSSYKGLGLLALCSALIGPLTLEVIYNHADLWFKGFWQDDAFIKVWLIWTSFGILVTCPWGLDRGFLGINPDIHRNYAISLGLIGVLVYLLFGLPAWIWLIQMSLVHVWDVVSSVVLSGVILTFATLLSCLVESQNSKSILGLVLGNLGGFLLLYWLQVPK